MDDTEGENGYHSRVTFFGNPVFLAVAGGALLTALGYAAIQLLT